MRSVSGPLRALFLSGDVTPRAKITLRRMRLDFGDTFLRTYGTIGTTAVGDDYYDRDYHIIWGDSCVQGERIFRLNSVAAQGVTTGIMYRAQDNVSTWGMTYLAAYENVLARCRIGVYPLSNGSYRVWYANAGSDVKIADLNPSDWAWTPVTATGVAITNSGLALHPISASEAIAVWYEDPCLYCQYLKWNDIDWSGSGVVHVIIMSDSLVWSDAHWSDAEYVPGSNTKVSVVVNITAWGSAHSLVYNKTTDIWSQTREVMPSTEEWGNLRVWVSGLSTINNRLWAVTTRTPVGSRDIGMAYHVSLLSSVNGVHWMEEDFVTTSALRGKLHYIAGKNYCYIVGNASVARAGATYKLGTDIENGKDWAGNDQLQKYVLAEGCNFAFTHAGAGSVPEITIQSFGTLDDLSILEPGVDIHVEIGA